MSDYNWCHGPSCHTKETQSRVRGSGDNKVLRTIKIKQDSNYRSYEQYSMFNYCISYITFNCFSITIIFKCDYDFWGVAKI